MYSISGGVYKTSATETVDFSSGKTLDSRSDQTKVVKNRQLPLSCLALKGQSEVSSLCGRH